MTPATLIIDVDLEAVDHLSGRLWALGTIGVQEQQNTDGTARLLAGFEDERGAANARKAIGDGVVELVTSDEWLDAWQEFANIARAGSRFVIRPSWLEYEVAPGEVVLHVDPGRAFGSGSHATTRMCLETLEGLLEGDERVLDVGCGSGLLSIGAARIGATRVDAVDIDPRARVAAIANAARNGVSSLVNVRDEDLSALSGGYDVIVANILAPTLIELAPTLVGLLSRRGRIVLSGIRDSQVSEVVKAHGELAELARTSEDQWVCVVVGHR